MAIIAGTLLAVTPPTEPVQPWGSVALFALATFICATRTVSLAPRVGTVSIGFVMVFAAMLRFGAAAAVICALVAGVAGTLFRSNKTRPPNGLVVLFNASALVISAWLSWRVYRWTGAECPPEDLRSVWLPAVGAAATYFLCNALMTVLASAAAQASNPWHVMRESVLWTGPIYLAGASLGVLIAEGHRITGAGIFAAVVPVLWVLHQAFKNHIERLRAELAYAREQQKQAAQAAAAYRRTVESLAATVDARDPYTHGHTRRVQRLAVAIAQELGCDDQVVEAVQTGALLHDVGKIGIPDRILTKEGRLTEEEYAIARMHAPTGADIVGRAEFRGVVIAVVRHHHERWDGSGYPGGLVGEETPLAARIVAVADVYDALTSDRPYRRAWPEPEAVRYLQDNAGRRFDPEVSGAFVAALRRLDEEDPAWRGEPGSVAAQAGRQDTRGTVLVAEAWAPRPLQGQPFDEDLSQAAHSITTRLAGALDVELGVVYTVDRGFRELRCAATFGRRRDLALELRVPLGAGVTGATAEAGFPLYDTPAEGDLRASGLNADLSGLTLASSVPILDHSGEALGAITVYGDTPLSSDDKSVLLRAAAEATASMAALSSVPHPLSVGPASPPARAA